MVRLSRHYSSKAMKGEVVWDEERSGPLSAVTTKLRERAVWKHGEVMEEVDIWNNVMRDTEHIQQIEGIKTAKLVVSTQIYEVDKYLRKAGQRARNDGIRGAIRKRAGAYISTHAGT